MHEFELPTNIKQIGSIGDGLRIYVEDYVCTYLKQYARSGDHCEKVAFLIGKYIVIDTQPVVFINGAIQGKHSEYDDGIETFTDQSYEYAKAQIDKYFKGFEIVGWMQSQPGYGVFLNPAYEDYHMENFKKPYQFLFVMDPLENMNLFFTWNKNMDALKEATGYFIYYDKNPSMQEYMVDNKLINLELKEKEVTIKKRDRTGHGRPRRPAPAAERAESIALPRRKPKSGVASAASFGKKEPAPDGKRLVNMLVSLSAILFVICFIMGAGLIQNDDRINKLELSLQTLNASYTYLTTQMKQGSQTVFAQQEDTSGIPVGDDILQAEQLGELTQPTEVQVQAPAEEPETVADTPTDPINISDTAEAQEPASQPQETADMQAAEEDTPATVINISAQSEIPETYVVQRGDNLNFISLKFYGTTDMKDAIMRENGITDPNTIYFGKVLKLPK